MPGRGRRSAHDRGYSAVDELERSDSDAVAFLQGYGLAHGLPIDARSIAAPEVFEDGFAALDSQAGMATRDERVVERDEAIRASADERLSRRKVELSQLKPQPMTQDPCFLRGRRGSYYHG